MSVSIKNLLFVDKSPSFFCGRNYTNLTAHRGKTLFIPWSSVVTASYSSFLEINTALQNAHGIASRMKRSFSDTRTHYQPTLRHFNTEATPHVPSLRSPSVRPDGFTSHTSSFYSSSETLQARSRVVRKTSSALKGKSKCGNGDSETKMKGSGISHINRIGERVLENQHDNEFSHENKEDGVYEALTANERTLTQPSSCAVNHPHALDYALAASTDVPELVDRDFSQRATGTCTHSQNHGSSAEHDDEKVDSGAPRVSDIAQLDSVMTNPEGGQSSASQDSTDGATDEAKNAMKVPLHDREDLVSSGYSGTGTCRC